MNKHYLLITFLAVGCGNAQLENKIVELQKQQSVSQKSIDSLKTKVYDSTDYYKKMADSLKAINNTPKEQSKPINSKCLLMQNLCRAFEKYYDYYKGLGRNNADFSDYSAGLKCLQSSAFYYKSVRNNLNQNQSTEIGNAISFMNENIHEDVYGIGELKQTQLWLGMSKIKFKKMKDELCP